MMGPVGFLIIVSTFIVIAHAGYPLYIDELEDLVSRADKMQLDALDKDKFSPRSNIQSQVNEILARQSPQVQDAYKNIVQMKQAQRSAKEQMKSSRAQQMNAGDAYRQLESIQGNMALSKNEVKMQTSALKRQLGPAFGDSSSNSNEMY